MKTAREKFTPLSKDGIKPEVELFLHRLRDKLTNQIENKFNNLNLDEDDMDYDLEIDYNNRVSVNFSGFDFDVGEALDIDSLFDESVEKTITSFVNDYKTDELASEALADQEQILKSIRNK